jgi:hypothetical protein
MTKELCEKALQTYLDVKHSAEELLQTYYQDKSIPLDERWSMFEKSGFGSHKDWIQHFLIDDFDYDDFFYEYASKYETINFINKINNYVEDFDESEVDDTHPSLEQVDLLKEHLLKENLRSCKFDW